MHHSDVTIGGILKHTIEGFADILKGQESKKLSDKHIIHIGDLGYMKIHHITPEEAEEREKMIEEIVGEL